jgi:hypothetical protein
MKFILNRRSYYYIIWKLFSVSTRSHELTLMFESIMFFRLLNLTLIIKYYITFLRHNKKIEVLRFKLKSKLSLF